MPIIRHLLAGLLWLLLPSTARAAAPEFDRPGIAFATSTLPAGAFDWEQGLPDVQRDDAGGVRSTLYSADTTLRFGLTSTFELQLGGAAWNRLDTRSAGVGTHSEGGGDTKIAVKWAPALTSRDVSIAFLAGVTEATGAAAFSNGRPQYSLGATIGRDLGAGRALAMYANVNRSGGTTTWTFSPNYSFPLTDGVGGYVEAGRTFGGGATGTVAGGGLTWLLYKRVQLDVFGLRGMSGQSPDVQAGIGISAFWH